jgi:4-amino-4-deoxy-L-arabinose transferase-like glycosyltransferase
MKYLHEWIRLITTSPARLGGVAGLIATSLVLATLGDPGITCDEPLDVRPGRTYVLTLLREGAGFWKPATVDRVFRDNAEHPPLGRWLLGIASYLGEPLENLGLLGGRDPFDVHAGRIAPAIAFGVMTGLIVAATARNIGRVAAIAAGCAIVAAPRLFAHAHLAALDTFLCLFSIAALIAVDRALSRPKALVALTLAGFVWGLAILTKIPAWLLVPVVFLESLARLGFRRGLIGFACWIFAGIATFIGGWPWLWTHSFERIRAYFGTGIERIPLRVEYFGTYYWDREVPWHYPWIYFVLTIPIGSHLLGTIGAIRFAGSRASRSFARPFVITIAIFLIVFSTRVPVYDGERLFLIVFPAYAVLIGDGFSAVWRALAGRFVKIRVGLIAFMLIQFYGTIAYHPFQLSYYNMISGGLKGAERLGLEPTYWGDTVDRVLLDELANRARPGETVSLVPTLHHIQAIAATTDRLLEAKITLVDQVHALESDWIVAYRRSAYWPAPFAQYIKRRPAEFLRSRRGVWLAGIWRGPGRNAEKQAPSPATIKNRASP